MKTFSIIVVVVLMASACQPIKNDVTVPASIKEAFQKIHPNATDVKWIQEPSIFEAKFKDGPLQGAISFNEQGEVVETEEVIQQEQLPNLSGIQAYIKANYPGQSIQHSEKIMKSDSTVLYEIQIKGMELVFDSTGQFSEVEPD